MLQGDDMQKFNMMAAWNSTLHLFKENWVKIGIVQLIAFSVSIGSFFLLFGSMSGALMDPTQADPGLLAAEMAGKMGIFILVMLLVMIFSLTGYFISWRIALAQPEESLGGAIAYGFIATFPAIFAAIVAYIGFTIVMTILIVIVALPFGLAIGDTLNFDSPAASAGAILGVIFFYIGLLASMLFLFARLGTTGAIMAANRSYNPFSAMIESWRMTKGNSLMLMLYLFIISIVFFVVYILLALVGGLFAAISMVLGGIVGGVFFVALLIIYALIPAGIYDSLSVKKVEVGDVFT